MPRRNGKEVPCEYCGKMVYKAKWRLERDKHHFCSHDCQARFYTGKKDPFSRRTGKEVACEYCGKMIYRAEWELNNGKRNFCSVECAGKFRSAHPEIYLPPSTLIEKQCKQCGKTFKHIPAVDQQFCSMECWREWKHNHLGIDDPRSTRIKTTCDWCGKEMNCIPARFNNHEYHFCSRGCQQE